MLPWVQPQPCRQLGTVPESRWIGHRGGNRRGCDRADAGDSGEVAAGLVRLVPSQDSPFQYVNMLIAFVDLVSDLPKGEAGQLRHFSVVEAGDELLDLAAPLRRDDTEFGKMNPYGVDQHGALAHQQIACPVQHQDGLLRFVLDRHEYHVRPHQRLDDCGSVIGVVLSAVLDVWLDLGGRNQPHLMAQCRDPSGPVVGGSARFHADDTGGQHFEKYFHASAAKLSAQHRSPGLVNCMDLKNVFGEIKTYNRNRHLDDPQNVALQLRPPYGIQCGSQRSSTPSPRVQKSSACEVFQSTVVRGRAGNRLIASDSAHGRAVNRVAGFWYTPAADLPSGGGRSCPEADR